MNSGVNIINKVLKRMINKITYLFMTAIEGTFEQKAMEGKNKHPGKTLLFGLDTINQKYN